MIYSQFYVCVNRLPPLEIRIDSSVRFVRIRLVRILTFRCRRYHDKRSYSYLMTNTSNRSRNIFEKCSYLLLKLMTQSHSSRKSYANHMQRHQSINHQHCSIESLDLIHPDMTATFTLGIFFIHSNGCMLLTRVVSVTDVGRCFEIFVSTISPQIIDKRCFQYVLPE